MSARVALIEVWCAGIPIKATRASELLVSRLVARGQLGSVFTKAPSLCWETTTKSFRELASGVLHSSDQGCLLRLFNRAVPVHQIDCGYGFTEVVKYSRGNGGMPAGNHAQFPGETLLAFGDKQCF